MFTPYGYARQNIGDALAGTLILLWEVVNNADAFRHGPGIRSVRDSVHAVLAQKPKIQALSDAEKQRNAEIAKYGSIFFIDTCKQLRMAGDYESLRKCRDSAASPKNSQLTSKAALICCKILVINKLSLQTKTPLQ
jgi:hypothetical protein